MLVRFGIYICILLDLHTLEAYMPHTACAVSESYYCCQRSQTSLLSEPWRTCSEGDMQEEWLLWVIGIQRGSFYPSPMSSLSKTIYNNQFNSLCTYRRGLLLAPKKRSLKTAGKIDMRKTLRLTPSVFPSRLNSKQRGIQLVARFLMLSGVGGGKWWQKEMQR